MSPHFLCPTQRKEHPLRHSEQVQIVFLSKEFLERCCKCGDPIRGDMMRPKETGRPFHPECFRCDDCKRPIDKRYYSVDGRTICHDDYVVS